MVGGDDCHAGERSQPRLTAVAPEAVLDGVREAVVVFDDDGRVSYVNDRAAALADESASALVGRSLDGDAPPLGETVASRCREAMATGEPASFDVYREPTDARLSVRARPAESGLVAYLREEATERAVRQYESLVETSPDAMFALDADLTVTLVNGAVEDVTGYDRDALVGVRVPELREWGLFDDDELDDAVERIRRLVDGEESYAELEVKQYDADGEPFDAEYHLAAVPGDPDTGVVGVVRDVTDHKRQASRIRRQRDELDTLVGINALVHEIIRGLLGAASREEIEETVCERLAASGLYDHAWILDRGVDDSLDVRTSAGDDDAVEALSAADASGDGVLDAALSADAAQVVDVRDDERVPEAVRHEASDAGCRSCVVVPLAHGSTTYGALVAGTEDHGTFSDRERAAFEVLGETTAFAVNAVQNRQLLLGDNLVEYRFRVADSEGFFFTVADRLDCTCTLEWTVPAADDRILHYTSVADADPEAVVALADDDDRVTDARVLSTGGDATLFEVVTPESAAAALLDAGANPIELVADSGTAHVVVEAPPTVDLDAVVDAFVASPADAELVAKREVGRPVRTARDFREALADDLTDRQHTALQVAYYAGYFEWPRESDAEEVAESLGVSSATLHYHLRHAQQALLAAFFDE